ncbi:PEGA domain-containing protein [Marinobacter sp. CHS3-4]|uniref:MORN repeat-containing protein n=1 Tax=Marinobacter sp. CHS3-4 TaxID=3045174 RepID=UPI0024B5FFDC|nr:PEGA domain-containing protein [Marinobacter sp. CHS3-4]MDI9245824.1 PEGA domain-containing protein [Marinobacter sp. CHS3-4]
MVDIRPLLFINALALMLLVTAGFASVREDISKAPDVAQQQEPDLSDAVAQANEDTHQTNDSVFLDEEPPSAGKPTDSVSDTPVATGSASAGSEKSTRVEAKPFAIDSMPDDSQLLAKAEPVAAMAPTLSDATPEPSLPKPAAKPPEPVKPEPAPPKTGLLVLRSNVVGDQVSINGKNYGATRLDLELDPGKYDVVIRKNGYQPWQKTITLSAGDETTLVGRLEAYTRVNYRDGTWIGGVKTGDGTLENSKGLRYEGHFVDGKFHGEGTAWYPDGSKYEGDWQSGQRHGEGTWRSADSTRYTGQFRNDQFSGQGTLTMANGDILTGQWAEGKLNGHGSLTTSDGMLYVGGFRNDEFHGEGTLTYPDGRLYEGEFSNGEFHGKGKEVFADGKQYEGQYIEGSFHGKGLLSNPNGSSIQATFRYGEPYGKVRLTTAAGEVFTARTTEPGVCYRDKSYRATQCPKLEGW